jgi:CHAT domain-containing protein
MSGPEDVGNPSPADDQQGSGLPSSLLELEVGQEAHHLTISAQEYLPGEEDTLRQYERMPVSMSGIEKRCHDTVETLNRANRLGRLTPEVLKRLKEIGQVFYDEFFPAGIKQKLNQTKAAYLSLHLDDQLVHMPWELFYDGARFLCNRFYMGRLVKTRQTVLGGQRRHLSQPLKMLIVADPEGDLKGAYQEGTRIRDYMDLNQDYVNVSLRSGSITPDFVKAKIKDYDLVHFAGHAEYSLKTPEDSGWRLTGDALRAKEIIKMAGSASMPSLIFSNACQSARTEKWILKEDFQNEVFGLANAFLLAGVKHYVGTFWEILDEPSSRFALEFYKFLLAGRTIGEAVQLARRVLIDQYGEDTVVWASYLLYGDPTTCYLDHIVSSDVLSRPEYDRESITASGMRSRDEVVDFSPQETPKKSRKKWPLILGLVALVGLLVWGYASFSKRQIDKYEKMALAHYHAGDFQAALDACTRLEEKEPDSSLYQIVRGNVFLRQGKLKAAEHAYQQALQATRMVPMQKAEALSGLGRLASLRKDHDAAINFYEEATIAAPGFSRGYLSQALLLENEGKHEQALDLLLKAGKLTPKDPVLATLVNETRSRVALSSDMEKQERIDQLVKELLESPAPAQPLPSDGWTSLPLTMWIMDLESQGYSVQEGEERLLVSGIVDQLLEHSRVRLVERALLDRLLQELKLGTSKMIEQSTALSLGKLMAARLILSGQVVHSEAQTQVSLRLIETETGRITAAVNESFGSSVPVSVLTEKLASNLSGKLKELYPLRGKIVKEDGQAVAVNIGQNVGVREGQRFKVDDEGTILEMVSIEPNASLAKIVKGKRVLEKGVRVEAFRANDVLSP